MNSSQTYASPSRNLEQCTKNTVWIKQAWTLCQQFATCIFCKSDFCKVLCIKFLLNTTCHCWNQINIELKRVCHFYFISGICYRKRQATTKKKKNYQWFALFSFAGSSNDHWYDLKKRIKVRLIFFWQNKIYLLYLQLLQN